MWWPGMRKAIAIKTGMYELYSCVSHYTHSNSGSVALFAPHIGFVVAKLLNYAHRAASRFKLYLVMGSFIERS